MQHEESRIAQECVYNVQGVSCHFLVDDPVTQQQKEKQDYSVVVQQVANMPSVDLLQSSGLSGNDLSSGIS